MKKILVVFLIPIIFTSSYADEIFKTEIEFMEFHTYYHSNPQPEKIIPSINYYVKSPLYENINSRKTIADLYANLLKNDSDLLNKLFENQNQSGTSDTKIFTLSILWLIENDESKSLIEKAKESWTDQTVQDIITRMQNSSTYEGIWSNVGMKRRSIKPMVDKKLSQDNAGNKTVDRIEIPKVMELIATISTKAGIKIAKMLPEVDKNSFELFLDINVINQKSIEQYIDLLEKFAYCYNGMIISVNNDGYSSIKCSVDVDDNGVSFDNVYNVDYMELDNYIYEYMRVE